MFLAGELGSFFSQAEGKPGNPFAHTKHHLRDDDSADDEYLNYVGIEDLLERFYVRVGKSLQLSLSARALVAVLEVVAIHNRVAV